MEKERIRKIESNLGVRLPSMYVNFLEERGSAVIDGFKVAGIPSDNLPKEDQDAMDVKKTTDLLRFMRPDLPETLIAVIFIKDTAVCLDLSRAARDDAPLVEVDLKSNKPAFETGQTFSQWLKYHTKWEKRFRRAWTRCRNRQAEVKGSRIQDWSAPILRVQDYIIGIGAFRFNYQFGCLEADEFLPMPQPHLKEGEPVRILLSEALARARDYCGSLSVQFTQDTREDENGEINPTVEGKRIPAPIPQELVDWAKRYSVSLPEPEKGFISHQDAVNLWFSSLEFPKEAEERILKLEEAGKIVSSLFLYF